jgi:hypothetical protein
MDRRTLTLLMLPVGLAACGDAPTAAESARSPDGAAPSALLAVSDVRIQDLAIAVADARSRVLPTLAGDGATQLGVALMRLDERLAAEDAAGVLDAADAVDAALATVTTDEVAAELDAVRLAVREVRASATAPEPPPQE